MPRPKLLDLLRSGSQHFCRFLILGGIAVLCHGPAWCQPTGPTVQEPSREPPGRLTRAAADPALEPWQRELAVRMAAGELRTHLAARAPRAQLFAAGVAEANDGTWKAWQLGSLSALSAIHDPVRDRMVVFGGFNGIFCNNDVWALSLVGTAGWTQLVPTGSPPTARRRHTAVYDSVHDRMIIFGGIDDSGILQNDVWALSLDGTPSWTQLAPIGSPPSGRVEHSAVYDPVRDRMIILGGVDRVDPHGDYAFLFPPRSDVWALSLDGTPAWTQLAPTGLAPSGRAGHSAAYDPVRDRMIIYGGYDVLAGDGTPQYSRHAIEQNDAWALSLAGTPAWTQLAPISDTPPERYYYHAAVYDPVRDRMIVFGGGVGSGYRTVWELSFADVPTWTRLAPTGSPPTIYISFDATVYDPVRDRMVIYSGYADDPLWALSLGGTPAWTKLAPDGLATKGRRNHTAVYDPVRDRMIMFGGFGGDDGYLRNDVWALSLDGTPSWTQLAPIGSPPTARAAHSAVYDPVRDAIIIFGGVDGVDDDGHYFFIPPRNDVWALSLAGTPAWTQLVPTGSPPIGRYYDTAIYDPVRDRMLVFGGVDNSGMLQNDVWALSLDGTPAWTQLAPIGSPPSGRAFHTAIYDPVRDRMIVFGGGVYGDGRNDVWSLSLADDPAWSELAPAGPLPPALAGHTAVYDPVRDRMVVFGGIFGSTPRAIWALSLGDTPAWSQLAPAGSPPGRSLHSAVYDPVRDRMMVLGGGSPFVLALTWGAPANRPARVFMIKAKPIHLHKNGAHHCLQIEPIGGNFALSDVTLASVVMKYGATQISAETGKTTTHSDTDRNGIAEIQTCFSAVSLRTLFVAAPIGVSTVTVSLEGDLTTGGRFHGDVTFQIRKDDNQEHASVAPNPFNPDATLTFFLTKPGPVRVKMYDLNGRLVRTLMEESDVAAGDHDLIIDGRGAGGEKLASGVYFYRIETAAGVTTGRFVIMK